MRTVFFLLLIVLFFGFFPQQTKATDDWWHSSWEYRTHININPLDNIDAIINLKLNLYELEQAVGISDPINPASIRIIDQNSHIILSTQINSYTIDGQNLELEFYLPGQSSTANLFLYFDTHQGASPLPQISNLITRSNQQHQGQLATVIQTPRAKYFFHQTAGGLASMIDTQNNDWISFNRSTGSAGMYRGVPNLVYPGDIFHPGFDHVTSSILSEGPLFIEIKSTAQQGAWETVWRFYPNTAELKVTKTPTGGKYWFLYEGTPGGTISNSGNKMDKYTLSNGTTSNINVTKEGDLPNPEWLYFEDPDLTRSLFFLHHESDNHPDRYYLMENNMTVFGFGRGTGTNKYLTGQNSFTLGFVESKYYPNVVETVNTQINPPTAQIGVIEEHRSSTPSPSPSTTPTPTPSPSPSPSPSVPPTPSFSPFDFNKDDEVNYQDLNLFINNRLDQDVVFDGNKSGVVDIFDFNELVGRLFL